MTKLPSRKRQRTGEVTLLEKALGYKPLYPIAHGIGNENFELALAWATGVITTSQAASAIGFVTHDEFGVVHIETTRTLARMASWIREASKRSKLQIHV